MLTILNNCDSFCKFFLFAGQKLMLQAASFLAAAVAAANVLCMPASALAETTAPPYQQANQTPDTQQAKTQPLAQDKQSAATNSSSQLPPLPTSFPLLPDVVVQPPQEVPLQSSAPLLCLLLQTNCDKVACKYQCTTIAVQADRCPAN